jgi:type IV pilus assembly protein PilB
MIEAASQSNASAPAISSRIKIMSKLDIAEKRRPQDGRIKIRTAQGREMDFRVSVMPTLWGEKVVMRLLDKSSLQVDMTKLGMEIEDLSIFKEAIYQPQGLVLITGPTGSGKTMTIYSALSELNKPDVNISTAEDPVEFNFDGINQVQMNPDIDLNFASALRAFLRQDPDIILVGEIRDLETAEIAIKAASTGHLVVSTLHTNDAPATVARLTEMGIPPYIVTSTVSLIVAQRLVGKICEGCKVPVNVDKATLIKLGVAEENLGEYSAIYKGKGCTTCNNTGIKGRSAIFELMPMTMEIREAILNGCSQAELRILARKQGMRTLRQSGLLKLKRGVTTVEEVLNASVKDS